MIREKQAPRLARYFITTSGLKSTSNVTCSKCGKVFSSDSFSNRYSSRGNIIILCPDCAREELQKGNVNQLMY